MKQLRIIKKPSKHLMFRRFFCAQNKTRTCTPLTGTSPSSWRVYQFHHLGKRRAKDGTRTRDPDLGKVVLYQLSYFRVSKLRGKGIKNNQSPKPRPQNYFNLLHFVIFY